MDIKTQLEKLHYDKQQENVIKENYQGFDWRYGADRMGAIVGMPFYFSEEKIKNIIEGNKINGRKTQILDYGCGIGVHSILPAKQGAEVFGVDISDVSIEIAKEWAKHEKVEAKTKFLAMDCEKLDFPDNSFDIVFNCGTLSCIDREKGYKEITRVLRPDGYFISVDTLGHNPILNLNRKIKLMRGLRTKQTFNNILTEREIEKARQYFYNTEVYYFNLLSVYAAPVQKISIFSSLFKLLGAIDREMLKMTFLQKYAFKAVFVFHNPKKQ